MFWVIDFSGFFCDFDFIVNENGLKIILFFIGVNFFGIRVLGGG